MVASEKETVLVEQHRVAARVPGSRYRQKTRSQFDRVISVDHSFRPRLCLEFQAVNDPGGAESSGPFVRIRNIVTMSQEDVPDASEVFEAARQALNISR